MLARSQRLQRDGQVQVVRQQYLDRVEIGVAEQFAIVCAPFRRSVLFGPRSGDIRLDIGDLL